ncbi:MAG: hypothetical protein WBA38_04190 [Gordonia sp. (in: high G+C Gram-positive bacteria)]|uniref:hypothetical protein n=1 Tax=Gordonia sp. (in: high G+C Gram-positive bacteria) TaxID=84139 RepID=UPI003C730D66
MNISVAPGPNGGLIGRDRNGQALAVVAVDHLNTNQRADLALIYRTIAALIDPGEAL